MQRKVTPAEIVIMASGAGALVFSFLDWYDVSGMSATAWSKALGFPTYAWIGVFGAVMAVVVALKNFANVSLPERVIGYTWGQIHIVLSLYAALLALSFLITDKFGAGMGIGFYLSLLAAAGLVVGAFMLRNEATASTGGAPGPTPPPPAEPPPQPPPAPPPPPA